MSDQASLEQDRVHVSAVTIPAHIQALCRAYLDGLKAVLGEKLYGAYLYGALAFPEAAPTADVDGHVILTEPLSEGERRAVLDLHAALGQDYPPLGAEMDVYYLLLADASGAAPPAHQLRAGVVDDSWALHRAHIHAGRFVALYGPDPRQVYPVPSWADVEAALHGELRYVEEHLADHPAYCALNLCRLVYSFQTRDVVVSKAAAAGWAAGAFPEWRPLVEAAWRSYSRQAAERDDELLSSAIAAMYRWACERISPPGAATTG